MKALGLSQQDLILQSLEAEFNRFDLRVHCKALTNANTALTEQKAKLVAERNALREALKEVSSKLGVLETASDCIQQIIEVEQQLQRVADKLSVVIGDRDGMQAKRDEYQKARDCFKARYEACQSDLVVVKAKLAAY